jgi:aryl-alcohol dehydrogenase-like predicted oxidoreductase
MQFSVTRRDMRPFWRLERHGIAVGFDTADIYSNRLSEEILGKAVAGKRQNLLISTKTTFRLGDGPNDVGSSRHHILRACDASLRRLGTDHIDIYQPGFDELTPVEETLETLDTLVRSGKVRYIACSNFSGWHLMKSLSVSGRYGWARYVAHQVYYSLVGREYESELLPLAIDQKVGALVWSPLGWGIPLRVPGDSKVKAEKCWSGAAFGTPRSNCGERDGADRT